MRVIILTLCLALFPATMAGAETSLAVFDMQKVVTECDAIKSARDSLDAKFGKQREDLEKERLAIEKKAAEYQSKKPTDKQIQDYTKQQRDFSEKAQAFMRLLQTDEARMRDDITSLISRAAKQFAEREGYAVILQSGSTAYFDPKLDVTAGMLAETNELWKKEQAAGGAGK